MCGIAGAIDLRRERDIQHQIIEKMAAAIWHRGPDEEGFYEDRGIALASRRLSIVGLADGQQPIFNEDGSVVVVFNGELFDWPEKREMLEGRGHRFRTHCDTEILVHLWEEFGEDMLLHLRGQYAFALYDRKREFLLLARDRIGIVPLHWARRGDMFYFCSEIKGILASGEVQAEPDRRGLDHIFTFFAMPTRRTCFKDVSALYPGSCLRIQFREAGRTADVSERRYWDITFPDRGDEYDPKDESKLLEEFGAKFERAAQIRLRADVPVVAYLSGGVDSTTVAATASRIHGKPLPAFTIEIPTPGLNEMDRALAAAKIVGCKPTVVTCGSDVISAAFPKLVQAAEGPVMDTSCAALQRLAEEVHRQGYKVALTGEGADEALAGYPWLKVNKLFYMLECGNFKGSNVLRWLMLKVNSPGASWAKASRFLRKIGGAYGIVDLYALISMGRQRFFTQAMWDEIGDHLAFDDLELNVDGLQRWHPANRGLYFGYKTMLPGLLMHHKGDRPAMYSSVETRYPFLDEEFTEFCAKLHPKYKLRGVLKDKYLLRRYAARILPNEITNRSKQMFRAPFANSFFDDPPPYVDQLLSEESLRKTGYFDPPSVKKHRETYYKHPWFTGKRLFMEMALTGVMATQLWHHIYLGGDLCDLPSWSAPEPQAVRPSRISGPEFAANGRTSKRPDLRRRETAKVSSS